MTLEFARAVFGFRTEAVATHWGCMSVIKPSASLCRCLLSTKLVRAVLTAEGLKNLQKQPPTALKAGVAKFVESVGGKLEFWYFDYGAATAYSVIDYPDEVAAATAQRGDAPDFVEVGEAGGNLHRT
jgi:uncharacterized protein with GYD domain